MNSCFKELAKQIDPVSVSPSGSHVWMTAEHFEAFANLLIKECVQVIYDRVDADGDANDEWDGGYRSGMCAAARYVEESFGDEE